MVYFPSTVNAPQAPSYSAPLLNFAPVGNLAEDYFKGTQNQQTLAQQRAFPNGLPRDAQGNVDTNAIVNTAAKTGGLPMVQGLLPFLLAQGGGTSPDPYPNAAGGQAAQPNASPAPGPAPAPSRQPVGGYRGGDNGTTSVASIVSQRMPEEQAGPTIARVAAKLGVDPNAPLDMTDTRVRTALAEELRGGTQVAQAAAPGSEPPPVQPQGSGGGASTQGAFGLRTQPRQQAQQPQQPQQPMASAPAMPAAGNVPPEAQRLTNAAARAFSEAERIGKFDPKRADALIARGKAIAAQADILIKESQPTPEMRNAGASGTQSPGEFEADKAIAAKAGGAIGETIGETISAGRSAQKRIQSLATIGDALKRGGGNITTGPFAETVLKGKQAISSAFGIDLTGIPEAEVAQKMGFQLATQAVKEISNRPTQMEFQRALQNNPGLLLSQKGSHAMIDLLTQSGRQDVELAKLASRRENWKNWQEVQDKFYKDNPLRSPFDPKRALGPEDLKILQQSASAEPEGAKPAAVTTKAAYDALSPGAEFVDGNGKSWQKPK